MASEVKVDVMESIRLREYFYAVIATLYRYAERIVVLEYPRSIEKRSVDLVVKLQDGKVFLLKVIDDLSLVSKKEAVELANLSTALEIPGFIVAERNGDELLVSDVVYEKHGVRTVNLETLEHIISGREQVYIYQSKDMFKINIDPRAMKAKRIEKNLSLGDIALILGTSRRAVYEYERGTIDPTIDKGEKLVNILGEEILKPINMFEVPESSPRPPSSYDNPVEEKIAEKLIEEGYKVYHAKRTVSDIGGSLRESRIMIAVKHRRDSEDRLVEKATYLEKMCELTGADHAIVADDKGVLRRIEAEGLRAYTIDAFIDMVKRLGEERK
ncbi:MAG: helix-turn-helix domain-containing protein [Desulfurococcales archaeon]|nr:helix-turn-helix domain-containing protein [Desulfurococcales archaeon]